MYICVCKGIKATDLKEKHQSIEKRGCGLKDICGQLGIGGDCGSCLSSAESYLEDLDQQAEQLMYKITSTGK